MEESGCVYFQEGRCVRKGVNGCVPEGCEHLLKACDPKFLEKWRDPLVILNRDRVPSHDALRGMLAGRSVFLVGGGPSANDLPLEDLNRKGVWSMGVNNVAAHPRFRPQAFVCSDPPMKFHHAIWMDPAMMKFVPTPKLGRGRRTMRRKMPDGTFCELGRITEAPNVWAFQRWNWLWPDDRFFLGDGACWGNHAVGVTKTGQPKTVCTMLLGLRILRFLGAAKVYLVGVDFRMTPGHEYSFPQEKESPNASGSNNCQFAVVNGWLCGMQEGGTFGRFGMEVFNCYEFSGLRAFPHVPFCEAIIEAKGVVDDVPSLFGWYEK